LYYHSTVVVILDYTTSLIWNYFWNIFNK